MGQRLLTSDVSGPCTSNISPLLTVTQRASSSWRKAMPMIRLCTPQLSPEVSSKYSSSCSVHSTCKAQSSTTVGRVDSRETRQRPPAMDGMGFMELAPPGCCSTDRQLCRALRLLRKRYSCHCPCKVGYQHLHRPWGLCTRCPAVSIGCAS